MTNLTASGSGRVLSSSAPQLTLAATPGFKVDTSCGERIGRVSSEWFSRPDDQRCLSLEALHDAVLTRAEGATARTVETRAG